MIREILFNKNSIPLKKWHKDKIGKDEIWGITLALDLYTLPLICVKLTIIPERINITFILLIENTVFKRDSKTFSVKIFSLHPIKSLDFSSFFT